MNDSQLIFPYPARVLKVDMQTRSVDLLALAKQSHAFDLAIFDERAPFFWSAEISNSQVDAYFTHMLPSTLTNFANEAKAGVSFLNSHRHNELPFGRSIDGRLTGSDNSQAVVADFYTLAGLNLNGITTDDFILGVRSGIIAEVSVGFFGGVQWCDICRQNYASWDCPHIAGMKYEVQGSNQVTATVGVDDSHLAEVSGVYAGATPDATILKAQRMNEAGKLKPDEARALEARYHRSLFENKRTFAGVSIPERKKSMELEQQMAQIRTIFGIEETADVVGTAMTTNTELLRLRTESERATGELTTLQARVKVLEPQAADGVTYRNDLVAEALAEGVRAMGEKFDKKTYEDLLRAAPLDVIKRMKADWAVVGDKNFPGGRSTTDEGEQAPGTKPQRSAYVPAAAYKA